MKNKKETWSLRKKFMGRKFTKEEIDSFDVSNVNEELNFLADMWMSLEPDWEKLERELVKGRRSSSAFC